MTAVATPVTDALEAEAAAVAEAEQADLDVQDEAREAEAVEAEADAKEDAAAYEAVRDKFIEQLVAIDLISEVGQARLAALESGAKARRLGRPVRTPDSVAVVLSQRSGAEGKYAIVDLQRSLMWDV
jgi:hypothetical protein